MSSEPPQCEWAPAVPPPRLAACRDKHRRGQSEGQRDGRSEGQTHSSESRETHGWTAGMKVESEKQAAGVRRCEGGGETRRTVGEKWRRGRTSVSERRKNDAELPVGSSGSHVGSTCARSIISGVYFGGVGGEGALLDRRVSVGRAVQAAVTHSVQVAAICPKTRRRYRKRDAGRADVSSYAVLNAQFILARLNSYWK